MRWQGAPTAGLRTLVAKSCPMCGELKMPNEFVKHKNQYLEGYCKKCRNTRPAEITKALQDESHVTAVKNRQPITDRDLQIIRQMVDEGYRAADIAKRLGRTVYAIYSLKGKFNIHKTKQYTAVRGTPLNTQHLKECFDEASQPVQEEG